MIRLHYVLGSGPSSRAIAWFTSGHFSHVDAITPDGFLLGARSDKCGGQPPGVHVRPFNYGYRKGTNKIAGAEEWLDTATVTLLVKPEQAEAFYDFLTTQIGKPYDSTAIWGFAAGRDWREDDSWFCSELIMAAEEAALIVPKLYTPANKISPVTSLTVNSALGAIITI